MVLRLLHQLGVHDLEISVLVVHQVEFCDMLRCFLLELRQQRLDPIFVVGWLINR